MKMEKLSRPETKGKTSAVKSHKWGHSSSTLINVLCSSLKINEPCQIKGK